MLVASGVDNHGFDISYSSMWQPKDICAAPTFSKKLINTGANCSRGR
jgi:hypothetical protein